MIDPKELLLTVDENNRPITPVERSVAHTKGIWHRAADIWVINGTKILCQRRSIQKDTNPGKWQTNFGGHMSPKDSYLSGAQKELEEETGIKLPKNRFKHVMIFKCIHAEVNNNVDDREFIGVFITKWKGDVSKLRIENAEVDKVEWRDAEYLRKQLQDGNNWVIHGYEPELIKKLIKRI